MRYIRFTGGNGYCGCDLETYEKFEDDATDEYLDEYACDLAKDNAESYEGIFDFEDDEEIEEYYESIYYDWEEVSEDEYNENTYRL